MIESLNTTSKVLSHEVGSTRKKRSLTPDVLKNRYAIKAKVDFQGSLKSYS